MYRFKIEVYKIYNEMNWSRTQTEEAIKNKFQLKDPILLGLILRYMGTL